jgi:hypothetical protein
MNDTYEFVDAEVGDYGYTCEAFQASQLNQPRPAN